MKRLSILLVVLVNAVIACSYATSKTTTEPGSDVGGTGGMTYTHDSLGSEKHMVVVTAKPGLFETEGSIKQRIHVFAQKFAARTCAAGFDFIDDPNMDQGTAGGFMKRTRTYVFVCRPPKS